MQNISRDPHAAQAIWKRPSRPETAKDRIRSARPWQFVGDGRKFRVLKERKRRVVRVLARFDRSGECVKIWPAVSTILGKLRETEQCYPERDRFTWSRRTVLRYLSSLKRDGIIATAGLSQRRGTRRRQLNPDRLIFSVPVESGTPARREYGTRIKKQYERIKKQEGKSLATSHARTAWDAERIPAPPVEVKKPKPSPTWSIQQLRQPRNLVALLNWVTKWVVDQWPEGLSLLTTPNEDAMALVAWALRKRRRDPEGRRRIGLPYPYIAKIISDFLEFEEHQQLGILSRMEDLPGVYFDGEKWVAGEDPRAPIEWQPSIWCEPLRRDINFTCPGCSSVTRLSLSDQRQLYAELKGQPLSVRKILQCSCGSYHWWFSSAWFQPAIAIPNVDAELTDDQLRQLETMDREAACNVPGCKIRHRNAGGARNCKAHYDYQQNRSSLRACRRCGRRHHTASRLACCEKYWQDAIHEGNPPAAIGRGAMSRKNPSVARHARDCRICRHADRQAIEADFIVWRSPSEIAKAYHIQRSTLYLHAAALGLMTEREKNVKAALSRFIERCANVKASAASFVAACVALSKINEQGQTIDRVSLSSSLRQAYLTFENWTIGELEDFAVRGTIPVRLSATRIAPKELP